MLNSKPLRILLASALQTAFWLAILFLNPFGVSSAADRASEDIYLRLYAALYPDDQRDNIKIVTLKTEGLPLPGGHSATWPLDYDEYVLLLKSVIKAEPKGVFVDLFFRPDLGGNRNPKDLNTFIDQLDHNGPPIVFAEFADESEAILPKIRDLKFNGGTALRALAQLEAPDHHYLLHKDRRPSAAASLYNATAAADRRPKLDLTGEEDFLLAWSSLVSEANANDPDCSRIVDTWASRGWALFGAIKAGLDTHFNTLAPSGAKSWSRLQPCVHHDVISAQTVVSLADDNTGNLNELKRRLQGKYVLVGADLGGSSDRTISPVHGELPGIHLHAAALDNLLTYKGPPFLSERYTWLLQATLILAIAILGRLFFENRQEPENSKEAARALVTRALAWVVIALAVLAVLLVNHFGPNNWGSLLAIAGALFFGGAFNEFLVLAFGAPKEGSNT